MAGSRYKSAKIPPGPAFSACSATRPRPYPCSRGQALFKKGDPADRMYVVLSGELRVGDRQQCVRTRDAGRHAGRDGIDRSCPALRHGDGAESDCTLAEIDEKRFLFLVQQTPSFCAQCDADSQPRWMWWSPARRGRRRKPFRRCGMSGRPSHGGISSWTEREGAGCQINGQFPTGNGQSAGRPAGYGSRPFAE